MHVLTARILAFGHNSNTSLWTIQSSLTNLSGLFHHTRFLLSQVNSPIPFASLYDLFLVGFFYYRSSANNYHSCETIIVLVLSDSSSSSSIFNGARAFFFKKNFVTILSLIRESSWKHSSCGDTVHTCKVSHLIAFTYKCWLTETFHHFTLEFICVPSLKQQNSGMVKCILIMRFLAICGQTHKSENQIGLWFGNKTCANMQWQNVKSSAYSNEISLNRRKLFPFLLVLFCYFYFYFYFFGAVTEISIKKGVRVK